MVAYDVPSTVKVTGDINMKKDLTPLPSLIVHFSGKTWQLIYNIMSLLTRMQRSMSYIHVCIFLEGEFIEFLRVVYDHQEIKNQ